MAAKDIKAAAMPVAPVKVEGIALAQAIEAAMSQAVLDATTSGITKPEEIRALMRKAHADAVAKFSAVGV